MEIKRKRTKTIKVGNVSVGGSNPVVVQAMAKSKLKDTAKVKEEIKELENAGAEIIRLAIPEEESISHLKFLMDQGLFKVPVVADVHFDYRLALKSLEIGVDCVRVNPGNIGYMDRVSAIIQKAKEKKAAIRIGVNSGSIEKEILRRNNGNIVDSMVESVLKYVKFFEDHAFFNFKISSKASSVLDTIEVYEKVSQKVNYPLHLGVTEAGPLFRGAIKSALGLGILLSKGIGDTIRVSLTGKSSSEVKAAYTILNNLKLRSRGVDIVSCPTCGRTKVDLISIVERIESIVSGVKKPLKLAVMGCIVNGPGEAKDADLGIAFGNRKAALFVKGGILKRVEKDTVIDEFKKELSKLIEGGL